MRRVLLRADGNGKIGVGHIHRVFAIAQMLSNNFDCRIFIQHPSEAVKTLFDNQFQIVDLPENLINNADFYNELIPFINSTDIVVLDGYRFDTNYQEGVKQKCYKLVSIDDIHSFHFVSDLIINHAGGLSHKTYSHEDYSRLCLGPKYALIKKEFLLANKRKNYLMPPDLLINLGGADPLNHTIRVLDNVLKLASKFNLIHVVIGEAFIYKEDLIKYIKSSQAGNVLLRINCSTIEMIDIMNRAAVAILSPSTVLFEYCSIGGLVFLEIIADNQKDVFTYFVNNGLALSFSDFDSILHDINNIDSSYKSMTTAQSQVFDQLSGERVLNLFSNF